MGKKQKPVKKKGAYFRLDDSTFAALDIIADFLARAHGYKQTRTDALREAVHEMANKNQRNGVTIMACPLCNHTMQNLGLATNGNRAFWCSRCGTIKTDLDGNFEEHETPRWSKMLTKFEGINAEREYVESHRSVMADGNCPTCGGSGGGDEPHIKCRACDGTGRRR